MYLGIDFKEIPSGKGHDGSQDTFELFSESFLKGLGYIVEVGPSRGSDGGKDLIVIERRDAKTAIRWLVSCKHFAHGSKSVLQQDELDIRDRVDSHNCDGFLGIYSTVISSGLEQKFSNLKNKIHIHYYDSNRIADAIVGVPYFIDLFYRFFPTSYTVWQETIGSFEPISLLEYYVKNEQEDFEILFFSLFKSKGLLIKTLRKAPSVELALKEYGFQYIIASELDDYKANLDTPFIAIIEDALAKYFNKFDLGIDKTRMVFPWSCWYETKCLFVEIQNYIFISQSYHNKIKKSYDQVRGMITK